ncbi:MAG: hypothetical protein GFH27_549297n324 [Chloroflexi bacterium AL-W]|nr:hypothetical protein [Chloroflexi bacterium AL-N1]NOK68823.1 hypothetical protein [Chloroflexi bacterium AL-N10]NOK76807.1 hypothetical protein [Chloroflexi bacterium AL-N5]NOK82806.1 hypothetical protein [Chloroflexi bacterium AL-W]NOK90664.1 hypothetical protein [Chloroflexi bacterium AL-N15]
MRCFLIFVCVCLFTLTACSPSAEALVSPPEAAWIEARADLPAEVPIYRPTWLPERFAEPELVDVQAEGDYAPSYTIHYASTEDGHLVFILGIGVGALGNAPRPETQTPVMVLGTEGILSTNTENVPQQGVSWQEGNLSYWIRVMSDALTEEELLQVVASLEPVE